MPLNAGHPGYGSVPGTGPPGTGSSDLAAPLLLPEPEPLRQWRPLSRDELEAAAGGPGWRKARCYLVGVFWLTWLLLLAASIAIIGLSPRPVPAELQWWQRALFSQLQPDLEPRAGDGVSAACDHFGYIRSLGIGSVILKGVFHKRPSPSNITATMENLETLAQIQHLLIEGNKADLRMLLDFCNVDLMRIQEVAGNADEPSNHSATVQHTLRFWLERGVAGFVICDTDAAYSEEILLEWRSILEEFSAEGEERIVVVKQTADVLRPLNVSSRSNDTLMNMVMRSILPYSHHSLSAWEAAVAIETQLQTVQEDVWTSWTVEGEAVHELQRLLLVLTMTLPGSPVIQFDDEIDQTQKSLRRSASHSDRDEPLDRDKKKTKRSATALFTTLSHSKASEEALQFGSFTFLPFNTSSNFSSSSNSTSPPSLSPPILAFLRSWGCVQFLVLLNVGPESQPLDPAWALGLPETGVVVAGTGMNRWGSTSLLTLTLQPHEAIVVKLFKTGSYS
ncbi:amino acid transporter heavy chain SLC3A2 [Cololabis saira]|uniref:amino acid transporter heavy chain SLC3A2 n=1 Tax=Cololabis saira TaxID=129043 RepID=UPI002AD595E1|nr:amino acid transporter heavy chain SLC3A2 [Cololabis saira]